MGFRIKGIKDGKLELGKYNIEPTTNVETLQSDEFNVIKTKSGIVYISKNQLELCGSNFWVTIYFERIHIKKVELSNADEKYKMNYKTLDSTVLENLRKENNDFLLNNLGPSYKENLFGREYEYQWGKIMSYFDIKSAEAGIAICYFQGYSSAIKTMVQYKEQGAEYISCSFDPNDEDYKEGYVTLYFWKPAVEQDTMVFIDNRTFYKYLVEACEKHIEKEPQVKEELESCLQQLKTELKV